MSKTLTLEVPDEIYEALERLAAQAGRPVEELALSWLVRYAPKPSPVLSEEERRAALARLRRHAGAINSGNLHSADNERVDADLAREYGNHHEEGV